MIDGIRLKFCGLTSLVDVEFADRLGADYLGFILTEKSPRFLNIRQFIDMKPLLPVGRKTVAVTVEPSETEIQSFLTAGFDRIQIHFRLATPIETVARWSELIGKKRLWLAPKLPPEVELTNELLACADTVQWDTYHAEGFGGSGRTGDWAKFQRYRTKHPEKTWILAGGLNPENIGAALLESGARYIDLSSGVELSPGIKDHAKMKALVLAVHRARSGM
jgi:phosphoribosylanthranilate isomerase